MPFIPLPVEPGSPVQGDYQAPVNPGTGERVSSAPTEQALQGLHDVVATGPRIQPHSTSGLEELGKGVQQLGDDALQIMRKNQRVTDIGALSQATTAFAVGDLELKQKLDKVTDPDKAVQIAQDHYSDLIGSIDTSKMSDLARAHFDALANREQQMGVVKAKYGAVQTNEATTFQALKSQVQLGIEQRNPQMALSAVGAMVSNKMVPPETGAVMSYTASKQIGDGNIGDATQKVNDMVAQGQFEDARQYLETNKALSNSHGLFPQGEMAKRDMLRTVDNGEKTAIITSDITRDPQGAYKALDNTQEMGMSKAGTYEYRVKSPDPNIPDKMLQLTPAEMSKFKEHAYIQVQNNSTQDLKKFADDMVTGVVRNKDDINTVRYPGFTPSALQDAKDAFFNATEKNDPKAFINFWQGAQEMGYPGDDPKKKADLARYQATAALRFDGSMKKQLDEKFDELFKGDPGSDKALVGKYITSVVKPQDVQVPLERPKPANSSALTGVGDWLKDTFGTSGLVPTTTPAKPGTPLQPNEAMKVAQPETLPDGSKNPRYIKEGTLVPDAQLAAERTKLLLDMTQRSNEMLKQGKPVDQIFSEMDRMSQHVQVGPVLHSVPVPGAPAAPGLMPAGSRDDRKPGTAADYQKLLDQYAK